MRVMLKPRDSRSGTAIDARTGPLNGTVDAAALLMLQQRRGWTCLFHKPSFALLQETPAVVIDRSRPRSYKFSSSDLVTVSGGQKVGRFGFNLHKKLRYSKAIPGNVTMNLRNKLRNTFNTMKPLCFANGCAGIPRVGWGQRRGDGSAVSRTLVVGKEAHRSDEDTGGRPDAEIS
jgi:hypothetical protein